MIWTITAKNFDGSPATPTDFDDGGDIETLRAHLVEIGVNYAGTDARPQSGGGE